MVSFTLLPKRIKLSTVLVGVKHQDIYKYVSVRYDRTMFNYLLNFFLSIWYCNVTGNQQVLSRNFFNKRALERSPGQDQGRPGKKLKTVLNKIYREK